MLDFSPSGYVIYICDTETTGKNPEVHEIVEFSGCRLAFDENFKPHTEQRTWYLRAMRPELIEEEALKINGHKREDILHLTKEGKERYREPKEVLPEIENWIAEDMVSSLDRILSGQNIMFDHTAMNTLWTRENAISMFPFFLEKGERILDLKQLVLLIDILLGKRRQYYNLSSLVKAFSIKKGRAHQASEDVRMTVDLIVKVMQGFRPAAVEHFEKCYLDE